MVCQGVEKATGHLCAWHLALQSAVLDMVSNSLVQGLITA